jgi:hypothetical protein
MPERIEDLLREHLERAKAEAWEWGFEAGRSFGKAEERFDPNWHYPQDEPTKPRNPYRR